MPEAAGPCLSCHGNGDAKHSSARMHVLLQACLCVYMCMQLCKGCQTTYFWSDPGHSSSRHICIYMAGRYLSHARRLQECTTIT